MLSTPTSGVRISWFCVCMRRRTSGIRERERSTFTGRHAKNAS